MKSVVDNASQNERKEDNKIQNNNNEIINPENLIHQFKININKKVNIQDFNLYQKIKNVNEISPLMIYILENSIGKFNNKKINNGIEDVGFGYIPLITNKEKEKINAYFTESNVSNLFVFYSTFNEEFIGEFWSNHQLLRDLLGVNPDRTILSSKLNLAKVVSSVSSNSENNQKNNSINLENDEFNREEKNNKEFYKLSLGSSFEYNSLKFLLYGINKNKNLPRIVFFPIISCIDYEEIDSVFLIEEMKTNLGKYYSNFKSINIYNDKDERKEFNLKKNDLVFVECSFEIENKKNKTYDFMIKVIKFIDLYLNKKLITILDEYTIKPIILYDNNYCLNKTIIKNIKSAIDDIKINIENLKNKKLEEIYKNLQIIYCWPTIPICNNYTTNIINNKLEESIGKYETELNKTKNQLNETNKELNKTKKQIEGLQRIVTNLQNNNNFKKFNGTNNYKYRYKRYNNNNYYKNIHNYYNSNYNTKYKIKFHYKYINNVNKRNNKNNNNYYYNDY